MPALRRVGPRLCRHYLNLNLVRAERPAPALNQLRSGDLSVAVSLRIRSSPSRTGS
jgi:hypothetical protein